MTAVLVEDRTCHSVPGWHTKFLTHILPAVETIARARFRSLPAVEREEGQADAVATAMLLFVRLVQRGKYPTVFAGRLAQVAVLRVLAGRLVSTPDNNGHVLSRYARRLRGIQVESLDARQQSPRGVWQEIVVEDRRATPAETAACRIDVAPAGGYDRPAPPVPCQECLDHPADVHGRSRRPLCGRTIAPSGV